jgi:iron complex transport system ATP-binding protein
VFWPGQVDLKILTSGQLLATSGSQVNFCYAAVMGLKKELVTLKNVSVRRGDRDALSDVSLSIRHGERVAVLGPNGSGKSTLLKLINRELYPTGGDIRILGEENWDVRTLRENFGFVSYDTQALFAQTLTGWEVVASGMFGSVGLWKNNILTPAIRKRVDQIMHETKVTDLAERDMTHISSGEARRLLLARALIHDPATLIFDEPMNSLDLTAQHLVKTDMRRLIKNGKGVVLVSHRLEDIIPEITRVVLLKAGTVLADGPKQKVLTAPLLRKLYGVPIKILRSGGAYFAST